MIVEGRAADRRVGPYSALVVANMFLLRGFEKKVDLIPLAVTKMVYLAHAWHLGWYDKLLVTGSFRANKLGPFHIELAGLVKQYGSDAVTELQELPDISSVTTVLSEEEEDTVLSVFGNYADLHPLELAHLTQDTAWSKARRRGGGSIRNRDIKVCYKTKIAAQASQ